MLEYKSEIHKSNIKPKYHHHCFQAEQLKIAAIISAEGESEAAKLLAKASGSLERVLWNCGK